MSNEGELVITFEYTTPTLAADEIETRGVGESEKVGGRHLVFHTSGDTRSEGDGH